MANGSVAEQGTLTKGARITGDQRSLLATSFGARYAAGESIRSIAQDTGRSYGFVHGVLKESGASLRGRGGATRGARRGPVETIAEEVEAAVDGVTTAVRTKVKAIKGAEKNGSKVKAKDAKPKAKKTVEAKKSGKKSGKKG